MENKDELFLDLENCPIRQVLDRFGDKWSILVLIILDEKGVLRFTGLSQLIGDISQKMLTVTLRSLEADGLIRRKSFPEIPPRVEYTLTTLGSSLLPHIKSLSSWADKNIEEIKQNRKLNSEKKQTV
ncbi:winged helix-turn-helix transcriptional regulator [Flavitalea flava]